MKKLLSNEINEIKLKITLAEKQAARIAKKLKSLRNDNSVKEWKYYYRENHKHIKTLINMLKNKQKEK